MELNINSPSYYKNIYGTDDEIYWMCQGVYEFEKERRYSEIIDIIGICPIVAPTELIEQGKWKEETVYSIKARLIIVKRHIDYESYVHGTIEEKKKLMIGNVLKSVKAIKGKGKIDYCQFESDLLDFLGYTKNDIKEYC